MANEFKARNGLIAQKNSVITGSLIVTAGVTASFTGSYTGDGTGLYNIPASGIVGLNLSQISSGSVSASISPNNGLQVNTNVTATSFTGSLFGTASWAENSVTASYVETAQTASYVLNAVSSSYSSTSNLATSSSFVSNTQSTSNVAYNLFGTSNTATGYRALFSPVGITFNPSTTTLSVTNISSTSITASLQGTASFATSASFAVTASYLAGAATTVTYVRRSDYTASLDPNINLLYLGQAESGSAESANVWDITRLSISSSGATTPNSASGVAWTDRYIVTYS